jgi:hypothetical protein
LKAYSCVLHGRSIRPRHVQSQWQQTFYFKLDAGKLYLIVLHHSNVPRNATKYMLHSNYYSLTPLTSDYLFWLNPQEICKNITWKNTTE